MNFEWSSELISEIIISIIIKDRFENWKWCENERNEAGHEYIYKEKFMN